jgi:hypothetical protein
VPVNDREIALAIAVTGGFENASDPYLGIAGDFDGMGLSCGVLQWNMGCNSLQPLVRLAGEAVVLRAMPLFGKEMWLACTSALDQGCAIVRGWQTNATLEPSVEAELRHFLGSPEMRDVQKGRIEAAADKADLIATRWAQELRGGERTAQEFVWFFDIVTQNGSMRGVGFQEVASFIASSGEAKAPGLICDWLENSPATWWGHDDSVKNAALWRDAVPRPQLELFVLGYLRASIATELRARGIVMNRKGAIATKRGFVNGAFVDFSSLF